MDMLPKSNPANALNSLLPLSRDRSPTLSMTRGTRWLVYSGIPRELESTQQRIPEMEGVGLPMREMQALEQPGSELRASEPLTAEMSAGERPMAEL